MSKSNGAAQSLQALLQNTGTVSRARGVRPKRGGTQSVSNTPKKKDKKRHVVNVGDIVRYHSPINHSMGIMGEVTHILDKNQVVVKALAVGDQDFEGQSWIVQTYKPTGTTPGGANKDYYWSYIVKVVLRVAPKPPKKPKKVLPTKVIETTEQLIEHLETGSAKERIHIAIEETAS